MNEFEAYQKYIALKLHFTSDYDYFKYNGKTNVTLNSFNERKDKFHFKKIVKKYGDENIIEYFVANLINEKPWIGSMDVATYSQWLGRIQSIEYIFENDSKNLLTNVESFDIIFTSVDGNHPKLVRAFLGKKITLETLVVFEKLLHYRKRFDTEIKEQIIWPKVSRLIEKYEPFIEADTNRCKKLLIEIIETEGLI
jgi:hypothetical protein